MIDQVLSTIDEPQTCHLQSLKTLTTEAVCTIFCIVVFIFAVLIGSLIPILDFFRKHNAKQEKPRHGNDIKSSTRKDSLASIVEFSRRKVWLREIKQFFKCFCIRRNARKIFQGHSEKEHFKCIHGIRCLGNIWIMYLHIFSFSLRVIGIPETIKPMVKGWKFLFACNGIFAVDAFFVISGFLNAFAFYGNYSKCNGSFRWFKYYMKRYLRLTAGYLIILGIYSTLLPYVVSGFAWPANETIPLCKRGWLWQLFYINNFQTNPQQCMVWCWYLAADMQFYILSPIFMVALLRRPKLGYILSSSCIILSCILSFILTYWYGLVDGLTAIPIYADDMKSFMVRFHKYFDAVYSKPYTRISSYLVGILLAHYLYRRKTGKQHKKSWVSLCFGWTVAVILICFCFFAIFDREPSTMEIAVYNGSKHIAFSLGLSWIIFVCLTGQGGFVNRFLSWERILPFSRLSYCSYLMHFILLLWYILTAEHALVFSAQTLVQIAAYVYFWTFLLSFVASLVFEMPVLNLLDLYLRLGTRTPVKES